LPATSPPADKRPRVVALLYVFLLVGMLVSALVFSTLLTDYSHLRLIQVVQGAAVVTMVLNVVALWKQEARDPGRTRFDRPRAPFREAWLAFRQSEQPGRLLAAVALGTAAFSMQDVLLEPYGGQILRLGVGATTLLTALMASGTLVGLAIAAYLLARQHDPYRLAALGVLIGIPAFSLVVAAAPLQSAAAFRVGTFAIGCGTGLFAVCMLTAAMNLARRGDSGLALGAWGAVQATAMGAGIALGGVIRDAVTRFAPDGSVFDRIEASYSVVYHIEIALLFATLVALGPLVRYRPLMPGGATAQKFGLAEFPG
jgi:BCD family chlorophyll transporter-like MFS transporter